MAARDIFSVKSIQYYLPDISQTNNGDVLLSDGAGSLVFASQDPQPTNLGVTQAFTAQMAGGTATSAVFNLVFNKDLNTGLCTVAFSPVVTNTQSGSNWTHPEPFLNTGTAGEYEFILTPNGALNPNYAQLLPPTGVQYDGSANIYSSGFTIIPPTWNYSYTVYPAVFTVGSAGNINIIFKSSVVNQNEFATLVRCDAIAGSSSVLGQYLIPPN